MKLIFKNYKLKKNIEYSGTIDADKIQIVGENGVGKSYILSSIWKNKNVNIEYTKKISYISQKRFLFPDLTVNMNIHLLACNKKFAEELINKNFGMNIQKQKVKHLSGGQQQFVHIIISLSYGQEIIVADEPFNDLSTRNRESIEEMLFCDDKSLIIVDHQRQYNECKKIIIKGDDIEIIENNI